MTGGAHGWQLAGTSADAYEQFLVPAIFAPWAETLVALAEIQAGDRVVDIACGTGAVTRAAAVPAGASGSVTGVDVNPVMLATARRVAGEMPSVRWREADVVALPFEDGAFDVALCQQGLQFVDDRPAAAVEMWRVLADRGRAAVSVWRGPERNGAWADFAEALGRHSAAAGEIMRSPFAFGDGDVLRDLLLSAGFDHVRITVEAQVSRFASPVELLRQETLSSPLAAPLGELDTRAMDALVADVVEALGPYVDDDGLAMPLEAHVALATRAPGS